MPAVVRATIFIIAYLLATAYALTRGGRPERQASLVMAGGLLLTWLLIHPFVRRYHGPEFGVAIADTLMLAAFVWIALRADRFWPLWMAAMQAVIVLLHLSMSLKAYTFPNYYKNTTQLWSYPQIALLFVGTLRHRLRMQPSRTERLIGRFARALRRWLYRERLRPNSGPASPDGPGL